jgi:hypothetical protein
MSYYHLLYDIFVDVTYGSDNPVCILCNDNFPTWLPTIALKKSEMEDEDNTLWGHEYKRNVYQCITFTFLYPYNCDYMDRMNEEDFFRIIVYSNCDRFHIIEIDLNYTKKNYDYDYYEIYLYATPPSLLTIEESKNLLLELFKKQMNFI